MAIPDGVRNKHHFRPQTERIEPVAKAPYDVCLTGIDQDGSEFRLTFNSYELRTEREDQGEREVIRRYYSNRPNAREGNFL